MTTWNITGSCEHCGFAYKGRISSNDGAYPTIRCPNCHKETQNFGDEKSVDRLNREDGSTLSYKESQFETVR
jgi:hypothetical protein